MESLEKQAFTIKNGRFIEAIRHLKRTRDEPLVDPIDQGPERVASVAGATIGTTTDDVLFRKKRTKSTVRMDTGSVRGYTSCCNGLKNRKYFESVRLNNL